MPHIRHLKHFNIAILVLYNEQKNLFLWQIFFLDMQRVLHSEAMGIRLTLKSESYGVEIFNLQLGYSFAMRDLTIEGVNISSPTICTYPSAIPRHLFQRSSNILFSSPPLVNQNEHFLEAKRPGHKHPHTTLYAICSGH